MNYWLAVLPILLLGVLLSLVRYWIEQRINKDVARLSFVATVVVAMMVLEFPPIFASWSPSHWAIKLGFTTSRSASIFSFCLILCAGGIASLIATSFIRHHHRIGS
jgi:hypothetical protein